jgi:RND family efflux transporter MFP subunit
MEYKGMKGLMAFLGLAILAAAAAYIFFDGFKTSTQKPLRPSVPPVTLIPLQVHSMPLTVSTYGYTTSPNSMTVRASAGGTIESIHFQAGQQVKKGQLLFVIQASDVTQQMNYLKPKLIQDKANYERNLAANEQSPGAIAKQALLGFKATYLQDLTQYHQLYQQSHISAAIDGKISDTKLAVGDLVSANDALASISSDSGLQVSYHLPSQWAQKAKLGQAITFIDGYDKKYKGVVSYVSPDLDVNNQGFNLRADMAHPKNLSANQFGQVIQVINPKQSILAVSQTLAQTDALGYFVLGVKDHKVVNEYFTPGSVTQDGLITIASGLKAGDTIISNPSLYSVGQKVEIAP